MNCDMKRIFTIFFTLTIWMTCTHAQAQESKFKALFLYKFSEYIEWQALENKVTIGVLGESDVFDHLSDFAKTRQSIKVIGISNPSQIDQCQILFIPKAQSGEIKNFVSAVGGKSILMVCDDQKYATKGGDICFYLNQGKLGFTINETSIKNKNMIASSKLLSLGKAI